MIPKLIDAFWLASIFLKIALSLRLAQLRLVTRYPWLWAWVSTGTILEIILQHFVKNPGVYDRIYPAVIVVLAFLECGTAWEVFSLRCERYGGKRSIGRGLLAGLVGSGVLVCVFLLRAQFMVAAWPKVAAPVMATKHVIDALLAVFLMSSEIAFSMVWKPYTPANILLYGRAFTFFLATNAAIYFVENVTESRFVGGLNLILQLNSIAFHATLLVWLRNEGEDNMKSAGDPILPDIHEEAADVVRFVKGLKSSARR